MLRVVVMVMVMVMASWTPSYAESAADLFQRVVSHYANAQRFTARYRAGYNDGTKSGWVDLRRGVGEETWLIASVHRRGRTLVMKPIPPRYFFLDRTNVGALRASYADLENRRVGPGEMLQIHGLSVADVYIVVDAMKARVTEVIVGREHYRFIDEFLDRPFPDTTTQSAKEVLAKVAKRYATPKHLSTSYITGMADASTLGKVTMERDGRCTEELEHRNLRSSSVENKVWKRTEIPPHLFFFDARIDLAKLAVRFDENRMKNARDPSFALIVKLPRAGEWFMTVDSNGYSVREVGRVNGGIETSFFDEQLDM